MPGKSPDAAWAETDELRVAERSNPQIKSYVRPEQAAEKGVKAVLSRVDISRHLTSEMFFSGDRLPGFSDTIEHPDGLVLELAAPTYLAHVAEVRVPHPRS